MKKLILIVLGTLLFNCNNEVVDLSEEASCDNGTFEGIAYLLTQQEVDDFGALCYSEINGRLIIGLKHYCSTDSELLIHDLSPLRSIKKVYNGGIYIEGADFDSFQGLHNLESTGYLTVRNCPNIINFAGLDKLHTIGGVNEEVASLRILYCDNLVTFKELRSVKIFEINYLQIHDTEKLESLDGLENLERLEYLSIRSTAHCGSAFVDPILVDPNVSLVNFCGLQNLFKEGNYGNVTIDGIAYNPTIQDIIDGNCSQ